MSDKPKQDKADQSVIKGDFPARAPSKSYKKKLPKKITESYLHNAGLYYLQRFSTSSEQFRKVMKRKIERSCVSHPEQDKEECLSLLENLIERFNASGLLNDELYTSSAVRTLRKKGTAKKAIIMKMSAKGIKESQAKEALQEWDAHSGYSDLLAALKYIRRRRIGTFCNDPSLAAVHQTKWLSSLARAGFDFETSKKALMTDKEEAESIIESCDL